MRLHHCSRNGLKQGILLPPGGWRNNIGLSRKPEFQLRPGEDNPANPKIPKIQVQTIPSFRGL
jgi:hypothetical protein